MTDPVYPDLSGNGKGVRDVLITPLQLPQASLGQISNVVLPKGSIVYNTDNNTLVTSDGVTVGGNSLVTVAGSIARIGGTLEITANSGGMIVFQLTIANSPSGNLVGTVAGIQLLPNNGGSTRAASIRSEQTTLGGYADVSVWVAANATPFEAVRWTTAGIMKLKSDLTVSQLPAAASNKGGLAFVTDANATTRDSTVAGGGSNFVLCKCNGTNWLIA